MTIFTFQELRIENIFRFGPSCQQLNSPAISSDSRMEDKALPTVTTGQPHLAEQNLDKLDVSKLSPLSPEVISRQATINIGKDLEKA